jgi:hypothetical protein
LDTEKLKHLLKKYNNQTATPEEKKVVEDWYEKVNGEAPVMTDADFLTRKESIFSQVKASIGQHNQKLGHRVKFKILRTHFSKAAIFIAILLAGAYF